MNRFAVAPLFERVLAPQILWSVFLITLSLLIIVSIVLWYHWRTYALQTPALRTARITFAAGSAFFVVMQFASLLSLWP
jgi:hypothetical protein